MEADDARSERRRAGAWPQGGTPRAPSRDRATRPAREGASFLVLLFRGQLRNQSDEVLACMVQARPHGLERQRLNLRDLFAAVPLDLEEHERRAPLLAHLGQN